MESLSVAVVGHVARQYAAQTITRQLGGRLFLDNGELGEIINHRRAWTWTATQPTDWALVVQDDAIPIPGMIDQLSAGLTTLPQSGLVSLYLGTSYPTHWQRRIRCSLARADVTGAAWLRSDHLLHGVAVAAPTSWTNTIVTNLKEDSKPYDEQLSELAASEGWPVYYTVPSLVDHADGPTLLGDHADGRGRTKPRHAWRTGAPEWNDRTVQL